MDQLMRTDNETQLDQHRIVSPEEWIAARKALLAREKMHTRAGDELSRQRRALPWVRVDKTYVFDTPDERKLWVSFSTGEAS